MSTKMIALIAFVFIGGAVGYMLISGQNPVIQMASTDNVIKFEAAGVNYAGWPEMSVHVNGEEIGKITVDDKERKMYAVNVPDSMGDVSEIQVKLVNESNCKAADFSFNSNACADRKVIVRGTFLNEEKLENPQVSGTGNLTSLLQKADGGISWEVVS